MKVIKNSLSPKLLPVLKNSNTYDIVCAYYCCMDKKSADYCKNLAYSLGSNACSPTGSYFLIGVKEC